MISKDVGKVVFEALKFFCWVWIPEMSTEVIIMLPGFVCMYHVSTRELVLQEWK